MEVETAEVEAAGDWKMEVKEAEGQKVEKRQTGGSRGGGSNRLEATEVKVGDWRQQRWRQ